MDKSNTKGIKRSGAIVLLILITFSITRLIGLSKADDVTPNISTNNWNISTFLYNKEDSSSLGETLDFYTSDGGNSKSFIVQVNYNNDSIAKTYEPGELTISIPGLVYCDKNYNTNPMISSSTSDNPNESSWRLVSTSNTETIITNNVRIEENANFQGNVQFEFKPYGSGLVNGKQYDFIAVLKENNDVLATSNIATLNFTSSRVNYTSTVRGEKLTALDGLPDDAGNYVWVKYYIAFEKVSSGAREIYLPMYRWNYPRAYATTEPYKSSFYILDKIPEDAVAYDLSMNKIAQDTEGVKLREYRCDHNTAYTYLLVGYPKEEYEDAEITNQVEVHGMYFDESEPLIVTDASTHLNLSDFNFEYSGKGSGGIYKTNNKTSRLSSIKAASNEGSIATFDMQLMYTYGGIKEDLEVGDDHLYVLDADNNYIELTKNEYKFYSVEWNGNKLFNANGAPISAHDLELWVRYDGGSTYEKYGETLKANIKNTVTFPNNKRVTSYKWIIKDVNESIKPDTNGTTYNYYGYDVIMSCKVLINKDNLNKNSKVYNFAYYKQYQNDIWVNKGSIDTYANGVTKNEIAPKDLNEHGDYLARVVGSENVLDNSISYQITKTALNGGVLKNDSTYGFIGGYKIQTNFKLNYGYTEEFKGTTYYDLLPSGMDYVSISDITIPNNTIINNVKTKSNKNISLEYLIDHMDISKIVNFNNTGRTLVIIKLDLSDDPLNLKTLYDYNSNLTYYLPTFNLNVSVPVESYLEFGSVYKNFISMDINDRENIDYLPYSHINDYNDDLYSLNYISTSAEKQDTSRIKYDTNDMNQNGNTLDLMYSGYDKLQISDLVNTYQDVLTTVRTNLDNYTFDNKTSLGNIYTYKIRVRPDANNITNLIIYDNLEEAHENKSHFKGAFDSVDTSYAENQGYKIQVYYSPKANAGKLDEDDSYLEYNDSVPKSDVKTLAFKYLNNNNEPAIINAKTYTYVLINMKAPLEYDSSDITYNNSYTSWNPVTATGSIISDMSGIISNTTTVSLNIVKTDVKFNVINTDKETLVGSKIEILDKNNNIIDSWIVENENKKINLPSGNYKLRQTKAVDGYIKSKDLNFSVNDNHDITVEGNKLNSDLIEMENDYTKVSILLTDGNNAIEGGKIALLDQEGNVIDEWTTSETRHEINKLLKTGSTYIIRQTKTIDGYNKSKDLTFVVLEDGTIQNIDVINNSHEKYTYITLKNNVSDDKNYIKYKVMIYGTKGQTYKILGQDDVVIYNDERIKTDSICYAGEECYVYLKDNQNITIGKDGNSYEIMVGTKYSIMKIDDNYSTYIDSSKENNTYIEKTASSSSNNKSNITKIYNTSINVKVPITSSNNKYLIEAIIYIILSIGGYLLLISKNKEKINVRN